MHQNKTSKTISVGTYTKIDTLFSYSKITHSTIPKNCNNNNNNMLPSELIALITLYTGDRIVAWVLKKWMTPQVYRSILLTKRRILIYGQVQSGKTAAMMDVIKNPLYTGITKIIIIQNSLLVLNQYRDRFSKSGIQFQFIGKDTQIIDSDVLILMNNKFRYKQYLAAKNHPKKYIILMDESDAYATHVLAENAIHEYYVTATPRNPLYTTEKFFHRIQNIDPPEQYQGLNQITIKYNDATLTQIVAQFREETATTGGMMLINCFQYVTQMRQIASLLCNSFPTIAFVTLNNKRRLYIGKHERILKKKSITGIIDILKDAPQIIFIANRMSLRGLSYTSSDYTRHLTHQYSDLRNKSITNALQRMRIFGVYKDQTPVQLILPSDNKKIVNKMIGALEVDYELNRWFVMA